jgi:hypothetical protein
MARGRPKNLSNYEKLKAKKTREFLSLNNISRFDTMNDATLLDTIRISDNRVFISLDQHNQIIRKISSLVNEFQE